MFQQYFTEDLEKIQVRLVPVVIRETRTKGDDGGRLEEQCGVVDCNKYTKQVLAQNIDGYAEILDKLKEGVILQGEDAKINKIVNDYMETVLIPICEKTDNLDEYKNLIEKSIDN